MKHKCPVPACNKQVPDALLMCKAHWRMLPMDFRAKVWNTYRKRDKGQLEMRAYLEACWDAVARVLTAIAATPLFNVEKESSCSKSEKVQEKTLAGN